MELVGIEPTSILMLYMRFTLIIVIKVKTRAQKITVHTLLNTLILNI